MKLPKKAHGKLTKLCPYGGFKGKDTCHHAVNCCCEGGNLVDIPYAMSYIKSLLLEAGQWANRVEASL